MTVTCDTSYSYIRIYIDGTLHLLFPVNKNTSVQSWIDSPSKLYVIEVKYGGGNVKTEYESKKLWKMVLKLLDQNL